MNFNDARRNFIEIWGWRHKRQYESKWQMEVEGKKKLVHPPKSKYKKGSMEDGMGLDTYEYL